MTRGRLLGIVGLLALLGAPVGCGGAKPTAAAPAAPNPPGAPTPPDPNAAGPKGPDLYELDPAKHVVPAAPATGRLAGRAFTPDRVELEGNRLTFRQGKDFFADLSVTVFLPHKAGAADGPKLVVRPSQKWTDGVPSLHVSALKQKEGLPDTTFVNEGYALTLELGKADKGKLPGKVYLCLPDVGRSYLAGAFVAERKRELDEPPGAEDVPFIHGSVSPPVKAGQSVEVGYVGIPANGEVISDFVGTQPSDRGSGGGARSMSNPPRAASLRFEKFVPRFDFTGLPPGRYLVYARVKDGPVAWAWATVAAGGQVAADLTLDEKKMGTVEVRLSAGEREARLIPTDLGSPPPDEQFLFRLSFGLSLGADAKDGKATIANVPAGKYQVRAGSLRADVEVAAGKTATVELKSEKK